MLDPFSVQVHASDLVEAFARCEGILQRHAGFDPLAVALQDPALRVAASPLYAFARVGRALADGPGDRAQRLEALAAWEDELVRAYHGRAEHPIFVALAHTVRRHDVPIAPLMDLLAAFRIDATFTGFETFARLRQYCELSAASAGRLLMHLGGEARPACLARSDELSIALRLVDLVVDIEVDARQRRVLVPRAELLAFGVSASTLARATTDAACAELIAFQVARARAWLARARPLLRAMSPALRDTVVAAWTNAEATLDRLPSVHAAAVGAPSHSQ